MTPAIPVGEHPADAVAGLWQRVRDLARDLDDAGWGLPTPCEEWSVHDLLGHLSGVQTAFDGSAPAPRGVTPPEGAGGLDEATGAGVAARRGWTPAQVLAELDAAAAGHEARLRAVQDWEAPTAGPVGPTTEQGLFSVRCYDVWVHLQDLHEALGRPVETRDASPGARVAYGFVLALVPWLYAKRARAPDGSAMRLVLGPPAGVDTVLVRRDGRARFDPGATAGDDVLEADPGALVLLVSGRGDPERWRDAGALRWRGRHAEAFARRARLFG